MKIAKRNNKKKKTITNLYVIPRHRYVCVKLAVERSERRLGFFFVVVVVVVVVVVGAMWAVCGRGMVVWRM